MSTTKLTPFMGSKDEWDTKEDPGKSTKPMYCMHSGMAKGTSRAEATSNSQAHSLSHCKLCESEGISQAVS